jgi:4-amino-4-deoxy-L-arabinose transferase-like glycosyltransferase
MVVQSTAMDVESGTGPSRLGVKFAALWGCTLLVKLGFAVFLPLFGDEAFYAWEALHPAWAYSDLPGGTAAIIAMGTGITGDTAFGLRWPFVAMAALLPWLVVRMARRVASPEQAWRAGLWSLPLPLLLPMGVMGLPDAPLTLAALLALDACVGLLRRVSWALCAQLALALALGAFSHYRFAPLLVAGCLGLWAAGGLPLLRHPRVLAALALGAAAWWPLLDYNLGADAAGLKFQLLERHPWAFQARGLLQPLAQAIVTTPVLYGALLVAGFAVLRERFGSRALMPAASGIEAQRGRHLLAVAGAALVLMYAALAPFADRARFSLHWPLPAYLALMPLVPLWIDSQSRRWVEVWSFALAWLGTLLLAALMLIPSVPSWAARSAGTPLYADNLLGWSEAAEALRPRLQAGDALVADNFMLAAQLSFALDRRPVVFTLDHWNNHKHGRAAQLAAWGYDEAGISRIKPGTRAWLMFEVEETPESEREPWVARTCAWFRPVGPRVVVQGPGDGKRFWLMPAVRDSVGCAGLVGGPPQ